ncbi:MAG: hypothetical protein WB507_10130 [Solirubrobacterales bacterium]
MSGALWLLPSASQADTPIETYSTLPSTTQAGGHPDMEINFAVKNRIDQASHNPCDCEDAKNTTVHFPPGTIGNPHAAPQCSLAEFSTNTCPIDSQIGVVEIGVTTPTGQIEHFVSAVYDLVPPPEVSGLAGFKIFSLNGFSVPQFLLLSSRTGGDYGLDATAISIFHGSLPLHSYKQDIWGVPAEHSHDLLRLNASELPSKEPTFLGRLCNASGELSTTDPSTIVKPCFTNFSAPAPHPSNSPLTPFFQNPTNCEAPLGSSLEVLSYDGGVTEAGSAWPQMTGCDQLGFNPSLYAQPTSTDTDTPSGIEVDLSIPQPVSPTVPSPTELKATTVTLPAGFSINPGAADGKTACSEAEARFGTEEEAQCPEFSKVGTLTIDSSALPGPLPGSVYLGQPQPGNRYRIFLVANGFAFHIKLAGTVTPNLETGQLTISFQNLPQTPLTAINMHLFGSERGLLATPTQCGTYPVRTTFTPWDETLGTQTSTQYFTISSGPNGTPCPGAQRPFGPGLQAASVGNTAAAHTPFSLRLTRDDGEQNLTALNITTPPGFTATLAGIPYCSDADLAAAASPDYSGLTEEANPSCPAPSQIGTAVTGAGAGTHPLYVSGKVYLAGPYKGAPLSLAVITPAVSGPYDLGDVVVRVAIHVNPETAQITAVSDPLPQIIEGIPLRLREVSIELNRPDFTLNPTKCDLFSVSAEVFGSEGAVAKPSSAFQVANCRALPFAPQLTLGVSGSTKHAGDPALHAVLTANPGEANISEVQVTLPHSEFLDNAHLQAPCTRVQYAAQQCPPSSVIGFAKAETPLLEKPLEGPVYLRSGGDGRKLPDIVAALNGRIDINLVGHVESVPGRLRTTFSSVPDTPVSKFTLNLDGGSKGLLENGTNLCNQPLRASVDLAGQNGKTVKRLPVLQTACGKQKRNGHRKPGAHQ